MRADIGNLLQRLRQRDFRYREFHDAFADMELWPIFEALLTDERVVGKPLSLLAEKEVSLLAERDAARQPGAPAAPGPMPPLAQGSPASDMFSLYEAPPERDAARINIRDFLGGLSSRRKG